MKRKPWPIIILALLHWLTPIWNVLVNSFYYRIPLDRFLNALLFPQNRLHLLVLIFLPLAAGTLIFTCRRWSYFAYFLLMSGAFAYSLITTKAFFLQNILFISALYIVNILGVGYFLIPNIRKIYFNPRLRWWQSKPRFATDFLARLSDGEKSLGDGHIKNISTGGFFIITDVPLETEQNVRVSFKMNDQECSVQASTVFKKSSPPAGYGFKVEALEARRSGLRKIVSALRSSGSLVEDRAPGPDDHFLAWAKKAVRYPRAWVPDVGK